MIENTLITNSPVLEVDSLKVNRIIKDYKKKYGVDVSYLFKNLNRIKIFKCTKTGFRFYYPLFVEGDNKFYVDLYSINNERLYQITKWEFKEVAKIIEEGSLVLDVGCGGGNFFEELKGKNCKCYGLDKSDYAGELLKSKGIEFTNEAIETYAENNQGKFDYVTGFQILEHVKYPGEFIRSMVKMLKKDGILIVAVPNNEPYFFKYDKYHTLNLPPHHMGMWNKESLTNIAHLFGLKLCDLKYEGLDYIADFLNKKIGIEGVLFSKIIKFLFKPFNNILGKRTVLAVYKKL